MSVVAITSSRTSPGATTLAAGLAIAWSHLAERSLLIEADPAGGVLALRFELSPAPSLTSFASDVRNTFQQNLVWANTQDMRGAQCMPAPVDPRLARSWIQRIAPTLNTELPRLGAPTVIDLGWVDEDGASIPLVRAADTTLIVTRPDVAEVQGLLFQIRRLQDAGADVSLVTIGNTPNNPEEIAALTGIPLAAVLPDDRQVAAALAGGTFKPNKFRRSLLWRTISGLAETLYDEQLMMTRVKTDVSETSGSEQSYPAPVGQPTSTEPPAQHIAAPQAAPLPDPVTIDESLPEPVAADAAWAPGTLEELAPHALAMAQPLPDMAAVAGQDQRWTDGSLHQIVPVNQGQLVGHEITAEVGHAQIVPAPTNVEPLYISVPVPSTQPQMQDLTPQNPIAPSVVATYVPTPPIPAATHIVDPGLFEVTKRMVPTGEPGAALVLANGRRRELDMNAPITIGRHKDCDIVLDDTQVSRQHGRVIRTEHGWTYSDLGSRNGTEINDEFCTTTVLLPGDVLTIGRTTLTFSANINLEMECV